MSLTSSGLLIGSNVTEGTLIGEGHLFITCSKLGLPLSSMILTFFVYVESSSYHVVCLVFISSSPPSNSTINIR